MIVAAELSCNHLGSLERAYRIVEQAARAGADAFKVQVWRPDGMCVDPTYTLQSGPWKGRTLMNLYREAWTPWEWLPGLFVYCRRLGLEPFGAPFDRESVAFLESLGVKRHKIASFELTDQGLIRAVAKTRKPMILSTGMATDKEIATAEALAIYHGCPEVTRVVCTSAYPAPPEEAGLATMAAWRKSGPAGLSDHTPGIGVAVAATALGATYIEKHLTLSRADGGPDAAFSLEPDEFGQLVAECRRARLAVAHRNGPSPSESPILRRGLWVVKDILPGESITEDNVRTARPALGLPPDFPALGRRVNRLVTAGTPLTEELLCTTFQPS